MKKIWAKFEKFFKDQGKTMAELGFRPGKSEEDITKAEIHVGVHFPADYRNFLLICNGQKDKTLDWLPDHMILFGVDEIIKAWDYEVSIMPMIGEHIFNTYHFHDKIRSIVFHRDRIPIAEFELGTCSICLDYIPGPKGTEGQLIFNVTESDFIVLAEKFTELIENYIAFLESGKLIFTEAAKGQESKFAITTATGKSINGDIWLELVAGK
ncbi:MAG: SMI1/KNR4 family protein [Candidatus Helarchaeota archaeon]|nr:SMI1/KNR4 family protein [Candidatus Helarchaeota archaeon]